MGVKIVVASKGTSYGKIGGEEVERRGGVSSRGIHRDICVCMCL